MPSENEGLALVTYEAMSMKLPVFFTDVGAQSELLKPEFLVPDEDPIAPKMVQAVWLFLLDKERRVRTGDEFRNFILEHHQAGLTFTKILELYQQLLENTTEQVQIRGT
jgi:glycosyltransferase involved in cell wall biosynthesis